MKLHFTFSLFIFCLFSFNLIFAQEVPDSLLLSPKQNHAFSFPETIDFKIDLNEPLIVPEIGKNWEKYIFQGKSWTQFKLIESVKKLPDGRLYLTYTNTNQSFHYFTTSDPISLQFDYHLKPLTHWEKLDVYFFGNSMLFYQYPEISSLATGSPTKEFHWETGVGVEYEYKEKKYLFYEYSTGFQNQSYLGKRNKAGVKFRF